MCQAMRVRNGTSAAWTGILARPQYQDTMVNASIETGNEIGNENAPNVFFNNGYTESCNRKRTTSQMITENICCSGVRLFPPLRIFQQVPLLCWVPSSHRNNNSI